MDQNKIVLLGLFILILIITLFFLLKSDDKSPSHSPSSDNITIKITKDGIKIPRITESYMSNKQFPCDSLSEDQNKEKAWCAVHDIEENESVEVIGYAYDDSIHDLISKGKQLPNIYKPNVSEGCQFGSDKMGCIYVQQNHPFTKNVTGFKNYKGDDFLEILWNDLEQKPNLKDDLKFITKRFEFAKIYEDEDGKQTIDSDKGNLAYKPKITAENCKSVTGRWFVIKPGVNKSIKGSQLMLLKYLNELGIERKYIKFDINVPNNSKSQINNAYDKEWEKVMASPSDTLAHQCPSPGPGPAPGPGPETLTGTNSESTLVVDESIADAADDSSSRVDRVDRVEREDRFIYDASDDTGNRPDNQELVAHRKLQAKYHRTLGECMGTSPPSETSKYHGSHCSSY